MRIEPISPLSPRTGAAANARSSPTRAAKARGTLVIAKSSPDGETAAAPGAGERPRVIHHLDLDFAVVDAGMQKALVDAYVSDDPVWRYAPVGLLYKKRNRLIWGGYGNPELKPLLCPLLGETGLSGFKLCKPLAVSAEEVALARERECRSLINARYIAKYTAPLNPAQQAAVEGVAAYAKALAMYQMKYVAKGVVPIGTAYYIAKYMAKASDVAGVRTSAQSRDEAARVEPLLEHAGVVAFTPRDQVAVIAGIRAVVFETNQRGALHDHHSPAR